MTDASTGSATARNAHRRFRLTGGCYVAPVRPRTGTKVLAGRGATSDGRTAWAPSS